MIHIKGPPSFTNSPHTPTGLPQYTTASKITKPARNIPSRHSNTPLKLSSIRKKRIGSHKMQPENHNDESTGRSSKANIET